MGTYTILIFAVFVYLANLIGQRAQKYGRRYWPWAAASLVTGPLGMLIVFLILESRHHKELEEKPEEDEADTATAGK